MTARPLSATEAREAGPRPEGLLAGNLLAAASMVVWAAGFPAAEGLLDTWHPFALVPARFAMALLLLLPGWIALEGWPKGLPWGRCLWVGGLGIGGAAVALIRRVWVWDEDGSPAGEDAMAWQFELRDHRVRSWRPFDDRDEALRAGGFAHGTG